MKAVFHYADKSLKMTIRKRHAPYEHVFKNLI
jgi:hypothetical protein